MRFGRGKDRLPETKADWAHDKCPTCNGTGALPQTAEEAKASIKRGVVSAPRCPSCGGTGRITPASGGER
jgi:DnaJ-class molecular chaperone